jgi:hypothetical protein
MSRLFCFALAYALAAAVGDSRGQEPAPIAPAHPTTDIEPRPTVHSYRLLINGESSPRGIEIVSIQPGSPLLQMESAEAPNLRGIADVGDVISSINGNAVASLPAYYEALDSSREREGLVELTLLDVSTGAPHRWRVRAVLVNVPVGAAEQNRKAHFLLVGLTDDQRIGKAMDDTLAVWHEEAVSSVDPDRVGSVLVLRAAECRAARILQAVRELPLASRDTLVCVYCGHGAFDPNHAAGDPAGGHFFNIPQGDLLRKKLAEELSAKHARLTVLISDTCNAQGTALPDAAMVFEQRTVAVMGFSAFEELLFDYRGVVDISGTDFGQYGFCQRGCGAWFSAVGAPMLVQQSDWRTAFERIRLAVDNDFQQQRVKYGIAQAHLTPVAFRMDVYRDEADSGVMSLAPPSQREITYKVRRQAP